MMYRFSSLFFIVSSFFCFSLEANANQDLIDWRAAEVYNYEFFLKAAKVDPDIPSLMPMAKSGNYYAQFFLGLNYYYGREVIQNYSLAFHWLKKSATNGHYEAMVTLADMYKNGTGPIKEKNPIKAEQWLRCAASAGLRGAQHFLGLEYLLRSTNSTEKTLKFVIQEGLKTGKKPKYNLAKAEKYAIESHMWLNLAAAQGYPNSGQSRDNMARMMSGQAIKKAQDLASNWVKRTKKCKIQQGGK